MASTVIPQHTKARRMAKIITAGVIILVIVSFTAGAIMLMEGSPNKTFALILIIASAVAVLQTILGFVFCFAKK